MKNIILILLIAFCSSNICIASNYPPADNANYRALFIGIDNYPISGLSSLPSSSSDSKLLNNLLEKKYGFTNSNVLLNNDATKKNILASVRKLANNASEDDHLLIFFAGHGAEIEKEGYWVPVDANSLEPSELISNIEIQKILKTTKSKHILILSDGFFAGSAFKSPSFFVNNDGSESYYRKIQMLISRQAITSGGIYPAFDSDEQKSVFTKYLMKFLEVNEADVLDAGELYELIKYPIFSNSPNMPRLGHLQYTGHEGGQFVFKITEQKENTLMADKPQAALDNPKKIIDAGGNTDKGEKVTESKNNEIDKKAVVEVEKPKEEVCNLEVAIKQGDKMIVNNWDNAEINVQSNNENASVQWFFNEIAVGSKNNLSVKQAGKYNVVVSTSPTCQKNATIEVMLKEVNLSKVEVFIEEGNNIEYTLKGQLSAKTFTKEAVEYQWKLGGLVISNKPSITVFRSGEYEVSLTYNGKEIARDYSMVVVHPRTYRTLKGDTPESIAKMFYKDEKLKGLIYKANLDKIKMGEVIAENTNLVIPAKEEADQSLSIKLLQIAGVNNFAPFSCTESYKNGIATDIIKTVLTKMEQDNEISFVPMTKQENLILTDKVVAAYPIRKTTDNLRNYTFSKALYNVNNVLFSQAKEPFDFSDEKNIKKKTVAFVIGNNISTIDDLVERKIIKARPCASIEEAFRLLERGQIDLVACSSLTAYHVFMNNEKINQENFYLVNKPIGQTPLYLAVSNKNPLAFDIIANFNVAFDELDSKGVITKIIDKHLDEFQKKP